MKNAAKKRMLALLAAALLLTGCGSARPEQPAEQPQQPDEVLSSLSGTEALPQRQAVDSVFSLNFDPEGGSNPLKASSSANMQFWSLLYDSVFAVDDAFQVSSEVVKEVKSEDHIWWVFDLNTDIRFSDGTPLTAQDVVYSIQRAAQSKYYADRLSCIYGISALDSASFAITTSYANSQFPALLNIPIIKKGDYFEDWPVGSGPYMLDEDHTSLVYNPESRYAGRMPVDTIYLKSFVDTSARITAFEDSSIDIVTNDPTGMFNLGYGSSNERRYYDTTNMHFIGFNMKSMYFQPARLRSALGYAIDREHITEELMSRCGIPAVLPVHPKSELYDVSYAETLGYDPEKAAMLFQMAGVDDLDDDGVPEVLVTGIVVELNIKFIVNNDSSAKVAAARQICKALNDMGITTRLYELTWEDYIKALEDGDYDMYYGELRLTPDWDLGDLFRLPDKPRKEGEAFVGLNYAQNTDRKYCELYSAYLAAPPENRAEAFQEAVRYITEAGAILPICFERREVLTHRGVISGLRATQYDLFYQFKEWTINLK